MNLLATTYTCKAALPHLRAVGNATIVNVSSVFGVIGSAGMRQYDTTKAAILGYTRAEPREMAYPILFLSCAESSFTTGVSLLVDAGKSIT